MCGLLSGCYNRMPQIGRLKQQDFSQFQRLRSCSAGWRWIWCLARPCFLGQRQRSSGFCPYLGKEQERSSRRLRDSFKDANPIHESSALTTLSNPDNLSEVSPPNPSPHRREIFHIEVQEGHNIQSITCAKNQSDLSLKLFSMIYH